MPRYKISFLNTDDNFSELYSVAPISASGYGVKADGQTNDDAAWSAAFAAAVSTGVRVVAAPPGISIVTSITVPSNVALVGKPNLTYTGALTVGSVLKNVSLNQAAAVVELAGLARISGIGISSSASGASRPIAIRASTQLSIIENCNIHNCRVGIDGNYASLRIVGNAVHECDIGVRSVVDGQIIGGNYINSNRLGLYLDTGANDNVVSGNKIEWNTDQNVFVFQGNNNVISNNVIDRSGKQGIYLNQGSKNVITSNLIRRSGAGSPGHTVEGVHIYLEGTQGTVVSANTTASGRNDDGATGNNSPDFSLAGSGNSSAFIGGNDFSGFVTSYFGFVDNPGWILGVNGGQPFQFASVPLQTVIARASVSPAAGATATVSFSGVAVPQFSTGVAYDASIVSRNAADGSAASCDFQVVVINESGVAAVLPSLLNRRGTAFGLTGASYNLSATCSADGSVLTLAIQNTTAGGAGFQVTVQRRSS